MHQLSGPIGSSIGEHDSVAIQITAGRQFITMALIFKELILRGKTARAQDIIRVIDDFCAWSEDYTYLGDKTNEHREIAGSPNSCVILDAAWPDNPCICFDSSNGVYLDIANVIPDQRPQIGVKEYNEILDRFVECFRRFCRKQKCEVRVSQSSDVLTLESIIPGRKTRQYFERYLARSPISYHPLDIQRLDVFICAAFRYCRTTLKLHGLGKYLISDLGWKESDARWCCNRIETGMDILKVNMRF